ncbi:choline/glycine/proline betaine transport protein [Natronospira proteinivora]|uniref:Choline/glycine/proline betaine transport protein n=1 Tax=Natronospira proteinivora TaxID=1807133 RepID=A0ABT1G6G9_9GAMM|nr:BCCT family transporter [Natronospira proteinivora]MCP1726904.1 choline/glycine/proline betaine transport protein [Natronospira proteinivora]
MYYNQSRSGVFKGMNPRVTTVSILIMVLAVIAGAFHTDRLSSVLGTMRDFLTPFLEWYYVLVVAFLLFYMIWLGVGRYKNVRLGRDNEQPEFAFFSWIAMLFAAGTGVGILFWAVAQPIMQFQGNPFVAEGMSPEAAQVAMRLTFFHWGMNGWAIFSFVALVLAYFAYRKDMPLTIRSGVQPLLGKYTDGPVGDTVDILAAFATVFGIATTLGLGVQQMNAGIAQVFGLDVTLWLQLTVTFGIMAVATLSVVSGVKKGVRLLSELNFWLSIAVVVFLLLMGPTQYLVAMTLESAGAYIGNLFTMTFYTNATHDDGWQSEWTVFFWGWWLAWSPFVGMFIARVSRGRTFREFVMGVLLVPTIITMIWIGLFGGTALYQELFGDGGVSEAVNEDVARALFVTIEGMGLGIVGVIVSFGLIVLIGTYLVTSANAGTLVINTILSGGDPEPPTFHRILWGGILAVLTAVLLVAGGLETLQSAVIMAALPFSVVILGMSVGLTRSLHQERFAARMGARIEAPREPWADLDDAGNEPTPVSPDQRYKQN